MKKRTSFKNASHECLMSTFLHYRISPNTSHFQNSISQGPFYWNTSQYILPKYNPVSGEIGYHVSFRIVIHEIDRRRSLPFSVNFCPQTCDFLLTAQVCNESPRGRLSLLSVTKIEKSRLTGNNISSYDRLRGNFDSSGIKRQMGWPIIISRGKFCGNPRRTHWDSLILKID